MKIKYYYIPYRLKDSDKKEYITIFANSPIEARDKADEELSKRLKDEGFITGEPEKECIINAENLNYELSLEEIKMGVTLDMIKSAIEKNKRSNS